MEQTKNYSVKDGIYHIGQTFYVPEDNRMTSDMGYYFGDGYKDSMTMNLEYAKDMARNATIRDRNEYDCPVLYSVEKDDEDGTTTIVTFVPPCNDEIREKMKTLVEEGEIVYLEESDNETDLPYDPSMKDYFKEKEMKEDLTDDIIDRIALLPPDIEAMIEPVKFESVERTVTGAGWHQGIDGYRYIDIYTKKGKLPGMQDYRFTELLEKESMETVKALLESVNKSIKIS